jgi:hypothetical protein
MPLPIAEQILSNLPTIITYWTSTTLCWGMYVYVCFNSMMSYADRYKGGRRPADQSNTVFMAVINVILLLFLLLHPTLTNYADMVVVINVFYNIYLIPCSVTLYRWWKTKHDILS